MNPAGVAVIGPGQLLGQVVRSTNMKQVAFHEVFYRAGSRIETHAHEAAFFGLTLDGHYCDVTDSRTTEVRPRGVVFHAAGEPHSITIAGANLRCFVLELDPAEIERRYNIPLPSRVLHMQGGPFASLLTSLYREFRHPDSCSALATEGFLLQLLVDSSRAAAGRDHPRWLDRVDEILHERSRSPLTLEEIAAEVGLPPARISMVFRRAHGCSLAEAQRRLRIEFACRRMLDVRASLADIADEAGFSDQPQFSRAFRGTTGMTPAQYRRLLLG